MASGDQLTAVFVYGTLKRDFTNYVRYLSFAIEARKASFVGNAETQEKYPMVVRPPHMKPTTCGPVMMDKAGTGYCIQGEVYKVDADTLKALDILEGVPSGFYYQKVVGVRLAQPDTGASPDLSCVAYFFPEQEELLALPMHPCYTAEHHALFRPTGINREIAELCQGQYSHGLRGVSGITAHCLRLLPGEDILLALQEYASGQKLSAAVVLSCVGSLGQAALRPAGKTEAFLQNGPTEILALSGTLSCQGHHLHLSISDEECRTLGGHVLKGCIVRTTAEITLGVMDSVEFTRKPDARTGFRELSIDASSTGIPGATG